MDGWMDGLTDSQANSCILCSFSVQVCQKQKCELHNSKSDVMKYGINFKNKNTT